jgi:hypothetical protein
MALALVGYGEGGAAGSGGATIATGARAFTTSNLIVVGARNTGASTIASVSDTAGNTYTAATQYQAAGGDPFMRIFYCANATGHATNVVTVDFGGVTSAYSAVIAAEFSGAALTSVFDSEAGGATTTSTLSSPALTTTNANDVVVVFGSQAALTTYSAGSGYTLIDASAGGADVFGGAYKITSAVISGVAQTIVSGSGSDGCIAVAAFKEAAAAGGGFLTGNLVRGTLVGGSLVR